MKTAHGWVTNSKGALRLGRAVCVVAGGGFIVTVLISFTALVRSQPYTPAVWMLIPGVVWLLIPGVPAIVFGQVWGMTVLGARHPETAKHGFLSARAPKGVGSRRFLFDGLPKRQGQALLAIAALAMISSMAAFPALFFSGSPDGGSPSCPYRLSNHGSSTCVSRADYEHAGAQMQRWASGIFASFFAIQFGIAGAELVRRRNGLASESAHRSATVST